jgi:general secretion pathway protein D
VKGLTIDLYITKGQSLREVLDIIEVTNGLEEAYIGKVIMLTRAGKGSTTLMGKILDTNKQGLNGVKVSLGDTNYKPVITQEGGIFIFEHIRPGVYIVKLEKSGYAVSSEVANIKQGKVTDVNIILDRKNKEGKIIVKREEGMRGKEFGTSKSEDGRDEVTERIQLKYGFADDIKDVVDSVLGETLKVTSFSKLHMLVIRGQQADVNVAKKLIDDLDRSTKQVRITAQILVTTDNLFEDLGFNWLFSSKASDINSAEAGGSIGLIPTIAGAAGSGSALLNFVDIFNDGKNLLNVSINMLQKTEDLSVSSVPSVVIVNGEQAEIKVTEEIIVGEREESDDDNNRTKEPIFEEAGTIFTVTPTIREGIDGPDTIILEIVSEVSDFKLAKAGTYNDKGGSKRQNNISTKIKVKDGDVIFIGGLKKTTISEIVNKVPILGDIPLLGTLFRSTETINKVGQVYIQITAEIVDDENKNREMDTSGFKENSATRGELKRVYPNFDDPSDDKK